MKMNFMKGTSAAIITLCALGAQQALADDHSDAHGYVGAAIGNSKIEPLDTGLGEWDTAFKVFAGYMFNENIGAEFTYQDMGSASDRDVEVDTLTSAAAQVIGVLPLGNFDLFAKFGIALYDAEFEFPGPEGGSRTLDGFEFAGGFGARYNWKNFGVRAEAESIDIDFGDLYTVSIGAEYHF